MDDRRDPLEGIKGLRWMRTEDPEGITKHIQRVSGVTRFN